MEEDGEKKPQGGEVWGMGRVKDLREKWTCFPKESYERKKRIWLKIPK